nr:MAG TPA: hypothetical protein [Caudoviricetes sp.]
MAAAYQGEGEFNFGNYTAGLTEADLAKISNGKDDLSALYATLGMSEADLATMAEEAYDTTAEAVIDFLVTSAKHTEESLAKAKTDLGSGFTDEDLSNLSALEIQRLANAKENARENANTIFGDYAGSDIEQIKLNNVDNAEGLLGFFEGLNNIDLQSENAE